MRAALYARLSKDEEGDLDAQLDRLAVWAQALGHEVVGTWTDRASGADPVRPGFVRLMEAARKREVDVILVVRLDRIMRSLLNLLSTVTSLDAWGVGLKVLDQPIDTEGPMGRFMLQVLGAVAEFERELIRERTRDGVARARASGKVLGRPRAVIPEPLMGTLVALRADGWSYNRIYQWYLRWARDRKVKALSDYTIRTRIQARERNGLPEDRRSEEAETGA